MAGRTELRKNLKIILDGMPNEIIEAEHVKPGKGNAFSRLRVRNLLTGHTIDITIKDKDGEIEVADVTQGSYQFLYKDGDDYHFMNPADFEQVVVSRETLGNAVDWLMENAECTLTAWNGKTITVELPNFIIVEVKETSSAKKSDTAKSGGKPATVETGAVVQVPTFIEAGDFIKVDTRTGEYVERAKV